MATPAETQKGYLIIIASMRANTTGYHFGHLAVPNEF